jgi:hypothetical protein
VASIAHAALDTSQHGEQRASLQADADGVPDDQDAATDNSDLWGLAPESDLVACPASDVAEGRDVKMNGAG